MTHTCHWPGCETEVPPKLWGCKKHWFMLPSRLRLKIWRTYVQGQEISKLPSAKYIEAAREVQLWILEFLRGEAEKATMDMLSFGQSIMNSDGTHVPLTDFFKEPEDDKNPPDTSLPAGGTESE